jgi:tetratricopeptide (TPR) repeat protein
MTAMKPVLVRVAGLICTAAYAAFIVSVYARQPRTVKQLAGGISATVGAYDVDPVNFEEGLRFFRNDQFVEARAAFDRADPARQDARTQFYIAYSFYRQGWGRVYRDDALYRQGIEAADRAIAHAPGGRLAVVDPNLGMHTADELRAELQRGLVRELSDLNPMKVFQERK